MRTLDSCHGIFKPRACVIYSVDAVGQLVLFLIIFCEQDRQPLLDFTVVLSERITIVTSDILQLRL